MDTKKAAVEEILEIRRLMLPYFQRIEKLERVVKMLGNGEPEKSDEPKSKRDGSVIDMVLKIVEKHYPINTPAIQSKALKMYRRRLKAGSIHQALSFLTRDKFIKRVKTGWYKPY